MYLIKWSSQSDNNLIYKNSLGMQPKYITKYIFLK